MRKFHVRTGDEVVVISGTEKGKRGKVIALLPKKQRAIIEGVKMIHKHTKKSQEHPEGAIVEREGSVHISNIMKAKNFDARSERRAAAETNA